MVALFSHGVTTTATQRWGLLHGQCTRAHQSGRVIEIYKQNICTTSLTGWAAVLWMLVRTASAGHMGDVPATLRGAPGLSSGWAPPRPAPTVQTAPSLEVG